MAGKETKIFDPADGFAPLTDVWTVTDSSLVDCGRSRLAPGPWKPSFRYSETARDAMLVFFDGLYMKNEPGPFPFVFTLGCLETPRPG
jgi:hypothetical protein